MLSDPCAAARTAADLPTKSYETHLSAQPNQAQAHPRLPRPHGVAGRPARAQAPAGQGAGAADPLNRHELAITRSRPAPRSATWPYRGICNIINSLRLPRQGAVRIMARSLDFPRKLRLLTAAQFRAVYQGPRSGLRRTAARPHARQRSGAREAGNGHQRQGGWRCGGAQPGSAGRCARVFGSIDIGWRALMWS